jgi:predicted AAA+ superfamily ATPase
METIYYSLNPWRESESFDSGIKRDTYLQKLPIQLERKQVEIITGSRRSGKTTLLKQFIRDLLEKGISEKDILIQDSPGR